MLQEIRYVCDIWNNYHVSNYYFTEDLSWNSLFLLIDLTNTKNMIRSFYMSWAYMQYPQYKSHVDENKLLVVNSRLWY